MASVNYQHGLFRVLNGNIALPSATIRGILLTGAGVTALQNKDLQFRSDITGEITSATNYTAGGTGILISNAGAGTTIAKDDANDRVNITFASATITGTSITAAGIIYFNSRGGAASADELLSLNDFGGNVTSTNADYLLQSHIMRIQN